MCSIGAPWRLAVMSDSQGRDDGVNARILGELAQDIANRDVEVVIFCGDLTAGSNPPFEDMLRNWRSVMKPVYDANIEVYPCRGNHDDMKGIAGWQNVFADLPDNGPTGEKHLTYSAAHKNALIVALDDFVGRHRVNQTWLDSELAANKRPHVFAFGHLPALAAYHNDCLDEHADERDTFWISLKDAGARTYFCGHDHFYDHAHVDDGDGDPNNDIHQYIVGTAGAPFYGWMPPYDGNNGDFAVEQWYHTANYGYVLVEVDGLEVTLTWMERLMGTQGEWEYRAGDVWSYAVPQNITVLSPNGGERLVGGNECNIEWKTDPEADIEHVFIEYMTYTSTKWLEVA
ncbi:MAG: metallophosphoesterase family protein, partial [Planctomycetota bacterium]